jgi:hypothetical protein
MMLNSKFAYMGLLIAMFALLAISPSTAEGSFAWRPQGRFGKRTDTQITDVGKWNMKSP